MKLLLPSLFLLTLTGCCSTREVTVELPAEAPSVVLLTDTLRLDREPPPPLPPDTVEIERTVPVTVTEYVRPRPDSSRATPVHGIRIDSSTVTIYGSRRDWVFRTPVYGETTWIHSAARDSLTGYVEGKPLSRTVKVVCPSCPECIYPSTIGGRFSHWLDRLLFFALGAVVGGVGIWLLQRRKP